MRCLISDARHFISNSKYKTRIIKDLHSRINSLDEDELKIYHYLLKHNICSLPYDFALKYNWHDINVSIDNTTKLPYIATKYGKLFFPKSMDIFRIKHVYNNLLIEQDIASPHCYRTMYPYSLSNKTLADIGCAEGNYALENIRDVKHLYLFECDSLWIPALQATFAPWKNKVTIINKYIGTNTSKEQIQINDYFADKHVDLVKVDVEGAELEVLKSGYNVWIKQAPDILICTYHHENDDIILNQYLERFAYCSKVSKGYMFYMQDTDINKKTDHLLRHGLLYSHCNARNIDRVQ